MDRASRYHTRHTHLGRLPHRLGGRRTPPPHRPLPARERCLPPSRHLSTLSSLYRRQSTQGDHGPPSTIRRSQSTRPRPRPGPKVPLRRLAPSVRISPHQVRGRGPRLASASEGTGAAPGPSAPDSSALQGGRRWYLGLFLKRGECGL